MREAIAKAPGKVNLLLECAPLGADGYHQLFTVFEAISVYEYVVARTRRQPGIAVETRVYRPSSVWDGTPEYDPKLGRQLATLEPQNHLAVRAAKALQPLASASGWGATSSGIQLTVHKTVPAAAGMAGGSADAAATLVALNELWELGLTLGQVEHIGRTLGADIPACLQGGTTVGVGRGDQLSDVAVAGSKGSPQHWWALAFSEEGLSTPLVFQEFDRLNLGSKLPTELRSDQREAFVGVPEKLAGYLGNDLAEATLRLRPELTQVGKTALHRGALGWMVSGSGPTVAALVQTAAQAQEVCQGWQELPVVSSTALACGPVEGTTLISQIPEWVV